MSNADDSAFVRDPDRGKNSDAIEARIRTWVWFCKVCDCYVTDPENHQFHAIIKP